MADRIAFGFAADKAGFACFTVSSKPDVSLGVTCSETAYGADGRFGTVRVRPIMGKKIAFGCSANSTGF